MKRIAMIWVLTLWATAAFSQDFSKFFVDSTLRLDYVFCGNAERQTIYFQEAFSSDGWAGRRTSLGSLLLRGNGQICVKDVASGMTIYVNSFSTLFQEWQSTEEAVKLDKAFENCFQIPFPRRPVEVTVSLTDTHGRVSSSLSHVVDPSDILIRHLSGKGVRYKYILHSGSVRDCCDIAILAEGYTQWDMDKFYADAQRAVQALMSHEPFASYRDKFNIVAVESVSLDSGVSVPDRHDWRSTASSSHFDTFYSERYLTTSNMKDVYDQLAGVPFEHIIIIANTGKYGGGGIFNSVTLVSSDHPTFREVLVHEFGHSFAGLGDEYYYDDQYSSMYPSDTEPWEPNLTTLVDFGGKWKDMLAPGTPVPTQPDGKDVTTKVGVYEGGGYQSKGVYRPAQECRMKVNEVSDFCPVCKRAIVRMIEYYTKGR
jgi:hypothetical protein